MEKIIFGELKKLCCNRKAAGFVLCLLSLHILMFTVKVYDSSGYKFSYSSYKKIVSDIDVSRLADEYERLKTERENIIYNQNEEPRYTPRRSSEYALYSQVLDEMKHVLEYDVYLSSVLDSRNAKSSISIFARDEYSIRNEKKTREDFEKLRGNRAEFLGARGINLITEFDISDLIGLILIAIIAVSLVALENEESTMILLRSTPHGRKKCACAKYLLGMMLSLITTLLLYGYRILLIGLTYGYGNLHGVIQSVPGYESCPFLLSIKEYLFLYVMLKALICCSLFSLFFYMAAKFRQSRQIYIAIVFLVGISAVFYYVIDIHHWLSYLKLLNPVALLDTEYLITRYKNINVFGYPVRYISVAAAAASAMAVCFGILGIREFCRHFTSQNMLIMTVKQKISDRLHVIRRIKYIFHGKTALFFYEIKKSWIYEKGIILLACVAAVIIITYKPMTERLYEIKDIYYKQYVKELEGEYTDEKLQYLYEQLREVNDTRKRLESGEVFEASAISILSQKIRREEGLLEAISYAEYLKDTDKGSFVYSRGYDILLGADEENRDLIFTVISAVLLMIGLSIPIWGIEESSGMKQVLRISYHGRKTTSAYKYINMLIAGIAAFSVIYIPWIYKVYGAYGFGGLHASVVSIRGMAEYPDKLTIAHVIIIFYFLHLAYLWIVGIGVRFINRLMKSFILTAIAASAVFVIPVILFTGIIRAY